MLSLAKKEHDLHKQEKVTRGELLNTAYAKTDEVLPSVLVDKGSIQVGKMMLEKGNIAYTEVLKKLDKIREKQKKI